MSTFKGVLDEFPLISIDRFLKDDEEDLRNNYKSSTYFLSHCHSDHMYGLRDEKFFCLLQERGFSKIYLSEVSEHLLRNDTGYSHLSDFMVSLPLEEPTIVLVPDLDGIEDSRVVVTLLTAGHCPGSVMFLIEGENKRILYTGDFRLPVGSAARFSCLHNTTGCLKSLDTLYIDTTFCNKKSLYIPTREECLDALIPLVESWLSKGPDHIICFFCPAQYAYEFVFVELYKRFGEKTHVTEQRSNKYRGIKKIEDAVTHISWNARIHACVYANDKIFREKIYYPEAPCGYCTVDEKPIKVRQIKPSAMFFSKNQYSNIVQYDTEARMHRVCYSTHSSLVEMRDMVSYLKPKRVYPNVVNKQSVNQILHLLQAPLSSDSSESDSEISESPLGPLKNNNGNDCSNNTNSIPFYDDCYNIPELQNANRIFSIPAEKILTENSSIPDSIKNNNLKGKESLVSCNEKIYTCAAASNPSNISSLKWNYHSFSSDDENFDPNSSFDSSKDKSESRSICSNSQKGLKNLASEKDIEVQSHTKELKNESDISDAPKNKTCEENITFIRNIFTTRGNKDNQRIKESEIQMESTGQIDIEKEKINLKSNKCYVLEKSFDEKNNCINNVFDLKPQTEKFKTVLKSPSKDLEYSNIKILVDEVSNSASALHSSQIEKNKSQIDVKYDNLQSVHKKSDNILSIVKDKDESKKNNFEVQLPSNDCMEETNTISTKDNISEPSTSKLCIQNILSTLYSSDSDDSGKLDSCSSWRQNKLVLDVFENETPIPLSPKLKNLGSQKSASSIENELNKLSEAIILNQTNNCNKLSPSVSITSSSTNKNVVLQNNRFSALKVSSKIRLFQPCCKVVSIKNSTQENKMLNTPYLKSNISSLDSIKSNANGNLISDINIVAPNEKFTTSLISPKKISSFNAKNSDFVIKSKMEAANSSPLVPDLNKICSCSDENSRKFNKSHEKLLTKRFSSQTSCSSGSLNLSNCDSIANIKNLPHLANQKIYNCSLKFSSGSNSSNTSNSNKEKNNNSESTITYSQSQSKRHHPIFGPNFKKKKDLSSNEDPDVICLEDTKKEKCIFLKENKEEIITVSSDDEWEDLLSIKDSIVQTNKTTLKNNNRQVIAKSFSVDNSLTVEDTDESEIEALDDSPSLLAPKFSLCDIAPISTEATSDKLLNAGKKRKSDEGSSCVSKNPKVDKKSASPDIFDKGSSAESTPDDFLPPTQKNYSSFPSFSCRNIIDF